MSTVERIKMRLRNGESAKVERISWWRRSAEHRIQSPTAAIKKRSGEGHSRTKETSVPGLGHGLLFRSTCNEEENEKEEDEEEEERRMRKKGGEK